MDKNDFATRLFCDIFHQLPRQGPGSVASTARALQRIPLESPTAVLDIGCGVGAQTLELARRLSGRIVAVDNYAPFLESLSQKAVAANISDRIETVTGSMFELPFEDEQFDLIWSEGAIYIMGFENGLRQWRRLLKPGGYMAVSDICWLKPDPPREIQEYFLTECPVIFTQDEARPVIQRHGYELLDHFILPRSDWWENFYLHMHCCLQTMKEQHKDNPRAEEVFRNFETEIELFQNYCDYFSYAFYIMQKRNG